VVANRLDIVELSFGAGLRALAIMIVAVVALSAMARGQPHFALLGREPDQ
jgi:hypothetical protein